MYLFSTARIFTGNSGGTLMKKVVLTYGLISGVIIAGMVWLQAWLCERDLMSLDYGELTGYASMLIALSMVFFGIKSYRDNYGGGKITFWKGVQVGLLITLIGGLMYYVGAVTYNLASPTFEAKFMQKYSEYTVGKLQAQGAPQEQIDNATANLELMRKLFKYPLFFFLIAMVEIMPVGILVTLVSAGSLRKKEMLPAEA
jgi:hypothetical protein